MSSSTPYTASDALMASIIETTAAQRTTEQMSKLDPVVRKELRELIDALAAMPSVQHDFVPSIKALTGLVRDMTRAKMRDE
jgi:hypothetical protein